ncbi:Tubulin-specific chaperone E [Cladobotryum mycophilum]|uniref:Tubulin-specific chaperone E n=1 Tax=Cladobotryum mycophilum TaxID=491253 RepID=A0ABR0SEF2_9HYPO
MSETHYIGQRISYDGAVCTVRYVGSVAGTTGSWLGVEWDDISRGKHDGSHKGTRYFTCISRSQTAASFVRPTRPADKPQSFIAALKEKYVLDSDESKPRAQIYFSTKLAEEVGFTKIWRQQSQLKELKIVVLENMRVATATTDGEESIEETCPKITQLDLSKNPFEGLGPVVDICSSLQNLQRLGINSNRFRNIMQDEALHRAESAFSGVKELALADTLLSWEELCGIASKCPSLTTLFAGLNQLPSLPTVNYLNLSSTLTSLNIELNEFASISDVGSLASLKSLRNLYLKGNNISSLGSADTPAPVFPDSLQYLDLSYNKIADWDFVDNLTAHFPGLVGMRIAHNPIYDAVGEDSVTQSSDESFMFTIARIAQLKSLNFTNITAADRSNAEMFYLSRIARQLATVPEAAEHTVTALHPRYAELCGVYGAPDVIRRQEVNPSFLEARLITVEFRRGGDEKKTARIPKQFDIYRVKGMVGKLFGLAPLKTRLVWETGDWDPVAGFDEKDDESSDEEDDVTLELPPPPGDDKDGEGSQGQPGRWVKREVELKDGPKLLGYCVDGTKVTIRVEAV